MIESLMAGVSIQFHMIFDKLLDFVADVMDRFSLPVELERYYPKSVELVTASADLHAATRRLGEVNALFFLYRPPRCRKFERFYLSVGSLSKRRLAQSHFGTGAEKPAAVKVLKQIARQLKDRTTAGIWVITEAGNVGLCKDFRYSPGAAEALRSGKLKLTSVSLSQDFRVDPPGEI